MAKPALGRGLGALLNGGPSSKAPPAALIPGMAPTNSPLAASMDGIRRVPLDKVRPCPFQPRKEFAPEALKDLADSIREQGIVQPLIVRESNGSFELIAGERRWRAAQLAGLGEVPILLRKADDRAVLELALIENLQRENLNPIEEAQGYSQLVDQFQLTQEEAAAKVGKSRAVVANALRLLKLPPPLQDYLRQGRLSVGHAKVILALDDSKGQMGAAESVLKEGLNVRQTEALVEKLKSRAISPQRNALPPAKADVHTSRVEDKLRERLGTKVRLRYSAGKGSLEIAFFSDAELERVLSVIGIEPD